MSHLHLSSDFPGRLAGPRHPDLIRRETLADLFTATAARLPDHTALIDGERHLSYGELDRLARQAASHLTAAGIGPGDIVGLWLPRGSELLVMQLAIALAGAAWLPFDADTPRERVLVCLADAQARALLTQDAWRHPLPEALLVFTCETLRAGVAPAAERRPGSPDDPAYVIYTSGSTGKPKGILIQQGAICHFLRSENSVLGIGERDRVYQGFSVAFDMSFEEIWISYLVGATLWLAPRAIVADPEALPAALNTHGITVLHAVPTLLALFASDVPGLRLINLGGEACPAELAERWASPGRRLFNTYGPTEATVSASLAELLPGQPVTIGRPLPNYDLLVIDPEVGAGLRLLPPGETGELCISGPGVSAGYLGRPELTAEKFLDNPWAQGEHDRRLYRTGDLARIGDDGQVVCLGRTDDQVKIRGYRVELGEIEALINRQPGIGTNAVLLRHDDGVERLCAYLVATGETPPAIAALRAALADRLPPYMLPGHWEFLPAMPRLTSGKIDRKALRALPIAPAAAGEDGDTPANPAEEALFAALGRLFPGQGIRRSADFFNDLGGHSLLAARLASALRTDPRYAAFGVRDIYARRQVGAIAEALAASSGGSAPAEAAWTPPPTARRLLCGLAQAAAIPFLVILRMANWLAPFFTYHFLTGDTGDSVPRAVILSLLAFLLSTVAGFAVAIAGKWLILGRLRAGSYPLWGLTYYRWWLSDRLIESSPVYLLTGSPLYVLWLRCLGARIGQQVQIGSLTLRAHDLFTVGAGSSIGNAVNFENVRVARGRLLVGAIVLEEDAYVGSYAVLEGNTRVARAARLEGQSALADGLTVPTGRRWHGSPPRDGGANVRDLPPRPQPSLRRHAFESFFYPAGVLLSASLFFLPVFPSFMLIDYLDDRFPILQGDDVIVQLAKYFLLAFPATAILIVCTALVSAGLRWAVLPPLEAGRWSIHSHRYYVRWLVNQIQEGSLNVLHGVYATIYASSWYRLLGANIGRNVEISTAQGVVPSMLTLGDETFVADAVMLGDEEIDGGWMTLQPTTIRPRSFIGNGAFVPDGSVVPENVLIGVHSRVPAAGEMQPGETWLGSPALLLPAREQTAGFPDELTFHPSPARRIGRGLVEACRIVTPHAAMIAVGYTAVLDIMPLADANRWGKVAEYLTLTGLLYGIGVFALLALSKWLLIGRYDRRAVPMWTPFVWVSEAITSVFEGLTVPHFMRYLRGTPLLPLAFRLLGCRIGRGVYLDTTDFTEFDCVHIADYSELNALCCPQTHLFEDRVMKIDHVHIGHQATLAPRCAVLYSAQVGDNAALGPLTLVMKGESVPAASRWQGCPAAPAHA